MAEKMLVDLTSRVRPALCLDLDDTVRKSRNGNKFIEGPNDVELFSGVEARLWEWRNAGYLIFGVTNQGGVAYGFKTWDTADEEVKRMFFLFESNPFHIVKQCFHHEKGNVEPWCHRSLFRKPSIGMLAELEVDAFKDGKFIVDWDNSLMVGDRPEDEQLAANAGIGFEWAWDFFGRERPDAD